MCSNVVAVRLKLSPLLARQSRPLGGLRTTCTVPVRSPLLSYTNHELAQNHAFHKSFIFDILLLSVHSEQLACTVAEAMV